MDFLEKDLENIIMENDNSKLYNKGLYDLYGCTLKINQVKMGSYGVSDMITIHKFGYKQFVLKVWEFKKDKLNHEHFFQLVRYTRGLQRYVEKRYPGIYFDFMMILVGRSVDNQSYIEFVPEIFDCVKVYTFDYNIDGIEFKHLEGYCLVNEGF